MSVITFQGSITDIRADVAVVSSDPQYSMNGGAARVIAGIGGRNFQVCFHIFLNLRLLNH